MILCNSPHTVLAVVIVFVQFVVVVVVVVGMKLKQSPYFLHKNLSFFSV